MAKSKGWIHGKWAYKNRVVEALEVVGVQKGQPTPHVVGWRARIVLGGVELITSNWYPTQELAEEAVLEACRLLDSDE